MAIQKNFMTPAKDVIEVLGGCRQTGKRLGINPSTVSRWMTSSSKKGTNGFIPQKYWGQIITIAQDLGKTVTVEDLSGFAK